MSKCFGIKYFFLNANFNLKKLAFFFKFQMPFSPIKPYLALGKKCQNYPHEALLFREKRHTF